MQVRGSARVQGKKRAQKNRKGEAAAEQRGMQRGRHAKELL